ncbi:MAG: replication factor C large subunit [Natronomonas sp.]
MGDRQTDWSERYRPTTLSEVRGNNKARDKLEEWAETWPEHGEAVVVHGSPGVGKTSAAHALANDMGWSVVEMNASDARTEEEIERHAGRAATNTTLGGSRQLIVLDEADNLHRHKDRGGAAAMTRLVKEATQPIVLIANDYYEMSAGLRSACREIEFRDISTRSIVPVLRDICRQEDVTFEEDRLREIAEGNRGDLRGAIKDLQARVRDGTVTASGGEGRRDKTTDIFGLLDAVLKEESPEEALQTAYSTDETPDDLLLWIEDKVPKVYEGGELADAYEHLADADVWLGRVRATQNYTYWRYATDNVAAGVASVRSENRGGWTRYGGAPYRSSRDATRDTVARQIAATAGVSTATAREEILPYLAAMTHHCRNRELTIEMATRYEFDEEAVSFVTGSGKTTNKVQGIVEEAERRREEAVAESPDSAFGRSVDDESTGETDSKDSNGSAATEAPPDTTDRSADSESTDSTATDSESEDADDSQSGLSDFL